MPRTSAARESQPSAHDAHRSRLEEILDRLTHQSSTDPDAFLDAVEACAVASASVVRVTRRCMDMGHDLAGRDDAGRVTRPRCPAHAASRTALGVRACDSTIGEPHPTQGVLKYPHAGFRQSMFFVMDTFSARPRRASHDNVPQGTFT